MVERQKKNLALLAVNGFLILILIVKLMLDPDLVSNALKIWLTVTILTTLAAFFKPSSRKLTVPILSFLAGFAVGMTLSIAFRNPETLWVAQKVWLPLALIAVIYHYWPTRKKTHFA